MNLRFYFEKLHNSREYRDFMKKNPGAFLCSGFFSVDKTGNDNKQHFDYFIPSSDNVNKDEQNSGKIVSFQLEENCKKVPLENLNKQVPDRLDESIDFNFEEIEEIISKRMVQEGIKNKIQKILFSFQKLDKEDFLISTVFISGFGMIKINIGLTDKKITDFEKKSFFDMINVFRKKKEP